MDTNTTQLDENQRTQLDSIVAKMVANKESDGAIRFVVNDFKTKYAKPPVQEPGFIQGVAQAVANPFLKIASSFRSIPGQLAANSNAEVDTAKQKAYDYGYFGKVTPLQNAGQALGAGANIGLTVATGAGSSVAKGLGLTGLKAVGARIGEGALVGAGFQAGSNLANSKPISEGLGTAAVLGGAIPGVGQLASKGLNTVLSRATPEAERLINSLIKPLSKDFAYGKNPARGILNEGIVASTFDDLSHKVVEKTNLVGEGIGAIGQKLDQAGVTLNLVPALKPIEDAIQSAAKSNNQTLFNSLNNVKTALLHDMSAGVDATGAPAIVKGAEKNLVGATYGDAKNFLSDIASHTKFTGNPSDDKALNAATRSAYGVARDLMNKGADSVSPEIGAQIRNLNERYGDLLSAKNAINHRDLILKRQNFLNLADKFSIPVAVGSAVATGVLTGDFTKAGLVLVSELGAIGATKALGSTYSKTHIAQFISRLAPEERQGILNSTPVLKNWYERITGQSSPGKDAPKKATLQSADSIKSKLKLK